MSTTSTPPSATERSHRPAAGHPRLLTIDDVAERLGVSVRHVRRLVFERRIPYLKWGHLLRFDVLDIDLWLAESRIPAERDSRVRG